MASPTTPKGKAYSEDERAAMVAGELGVSAKVLKDWSRYRRPNKKKSKRSEKSDYFPGAHPEKLREKAVKLMQAGKTPKATADELGLRYSTVFTWKTRAGLPRLRAVPGSKKDQVALGNKALARLNGTGISDGDIAAIRTVLERSRDSGATIESISVEGNTCTIVRRITHTFEF